MPFWPLMSAQVILDSYCVFKHDIYNIQITPRIFNNWRASFAEYGDYTSALKY